MAIFLDTSLFESSAWTFDRERRDELIEGSYGMLDISQIRGEKENLTYAGS